MPWNPPLTSIAQKITRQERDIFVGVTEEVQRSVVNGSEITGAAGQPVQTGALKASYIPEFLGRDSWRLTTNTVYARPIEEGVGQYGPLILRSAVGGFHSIALTVAGFSRIVAVVVRRVKGGA